MHAGCSTRRRLAPRSHSTIHAQFYDPEPTDFWSIEHFLRDYVDDHKDFPAQAMAQAISNQAVVGTTIKTGAGEYPIGFMSVLNVHTYRVCCRLPAAG
jgi:hypothetical protein